VRLPAHEIGVWVSERAGLLSGLARANELDLLVRIFLDEGEIDRAMEALAALKEQGRPHSYHTDLAVAQAAEEMRADPASESFAASIQVRTVWRAACTTSRPAPLSSASNPVRRHRPLARAQSAAGFA
jgi:hypothetical protein